MSEPYQPRMSPGMSEMLKAMQEASGQPNRPSIIGNMFTPSPRRIVSKDVSPPIPIRGADWCAYYEGEEEAGNYGWGETESAAIRDFVENCAEEHDKRLLPSPPQKVIHITNGEESERN